MEWNGMTTPTECAYTYYVETWTVGDIIYEDHECVLQNFRWVRWMILLYVMKKSTMGASVVRGSGTQTSGASVSSASVSVVNTSGNEIDVSYSRVVEYEKY